MKSQRKKRLVQANVKRHIQASLILKIQPKAGMGHVNTFKDLKTTAKLSQVQSTNSLKNTNSKFYSLIENLIQIPAKSYRVQPLSSSNTLEEFPTQELCKGSRSK